MPRVEVGLMTKLSVGRSWIVVRIRKRLPLKIAAKITSAAELSNVELFCNCEQIPAA